MRSGYLKTDAKPSRWLNPGGMFVMRSPVFSISSAVRSQPVMAFERLYQLVDVRIRSDDELAIGPERLRRA